MAGQSIMDRVVAARHSIAGQGLAKSVCKATTEELMGPKKKHIDCKYGSYIRETCQLIDTTIIVYPKESTERTCKYVFVRKMMISEHHVRDFIIISPWVDCQLCRPVRQVHSWFQVMEQWSSSMSLRIEN